MSKKFEWETWYYILKKFYDEHGNIDVPQRYITDDGLKLGVWLRDQRRAYMGNGTRKISRHRIQLLEKLNINWCIHGENWDKYYYELEEYYDEHGNIDVPQRYITDDGLNLGIWLRDQRRNYKADSFSTKSREQIQMLNDLDMDWNINDTRILNSVIGSDNKDYYYYILNKRTNYVLRDLSYEVGNQITSSNQEELCKTLVKRIWR